MTNKIIAKKNWHQNQDVLQLFHIFQKEKFGLKIVGGAIRNYLMNKPIKDIDFATDAIPQKTIQILQKYNIKSQNLAQGHGTISAIIKDKEYQITTIRKDIITDGRKAVVQFGTDWREDAERRDFTFNAVYADQNGALYDYIGTSIKDCYDKNIVFIGNPETRIKEDFLRAFRYFRFLAIYTNKKAEQNVLLNIKRVQNGFSILSAERIKKEMQQIINVKPEKLIHILQNMKFCGMIQNSKIENINHNIRGICTNEVFQQNHDHIFKMFMLFGENIEHRLKFSKKEAKICKNIAIGTKIGKNIKQKKILCNTIVKYGQNNIEHIVLGAAASINQQQTYRKIIRNINRIKKKQFPIKTSDLIQFGYQKGISLGKIIDKLYLKFLLSDGKMNQTQLIKTIKIKSKNFDNRKNKNINTIIIHSIGYDFIQAARILTDTKIPNRVSAHYLIDEDGYVANLVPHSKKAWHAGISDWAGKNDLNQNSIGIELVNNKHKFKNIQINALKQIMLNIIEKYQIKKHNILAHQDVATMRKSDPGMFFPWKKLVLQKIVFEYQKTYPAKIKWQQIFKENLEYYQAVELLLQQYGYFINQQDEQTYYAMKAFETRFCNDYSSKNQIPDVGKKLAQTIQKRHDIYKNKKILDAIKYLKNYHKLL